MSTFVTQQQVGHALRVLLLLLLLLLEAASRCT
jgi:hypothetical protein